MCINMIKRWNVDCQSPYTLTQEMFVQIFQNAYVNSVQTNQWNNITLMVEAFIPPVSWVNWFDVGSRLSISSEILFLSWETTTYNHKLSMLVYLIAKAWTTSKLIKYVSRIKMKKFWMPRSVSFGSFISCVLSIFSWRYQHSKTRCWTS